MLIILENVQNVIMSRFDNSLQSLDILLECCMKNIYSMFQYYIEIKMGFFKGKFVHVFNFCING